MSLQITCISGWFKTRRCILGEFSGSQIPLGCVSLSIHNLPIAVTISYDKLVFAVFLNEAIAVDIV